jgi:hypothetical protein
MPQADRRPLAASPSRHLRAADVGVVLGAIGGNAGPGAVAGAGLVGRLVYDHVKKNERAAYQQGYNVGKQQHSFRTDPVCAGPAVPHDDALSHYNAVSDWRATIDVCYDTLRAGSPTAAVAPI